MCAKFGEELTEKSAQLLILVDEFNVNLTIVTVTGNEMSV